MATWVVIYKRNYRRVRVDGQLTPSFEYPQQALNYIDRHLGGSRYMTAYRVR